jgi:transcriptional regulator with XRE-family HTH domain
MSGHGFKLYKSYSFVDKDPIIDRVRTIVQDSGLSLSKVSGESDVAISTLSAWFDGKTRRPQFASVAAVCSALGYDLLPIRRQSALHPNPRIVPLRARKAGAP